MQIHIDSTSYTATAKNLRQNCIILHYTACNFADSIDILTGPKVSAHYLIPTLHTIDKSYPHSELRVYSLVPENDRAWHAGVSQWGSRAELNDCSIGIEIVNLATESQFQPYPAEQVAVIIALCKDILARYNIAPEKILGHSDVSIGRKLDPGPTFPWLQLHQNGVGAWFDQATMQQYLQKFSLQMPSTQFIINKLQEYGYSKNVDPLLLFKAFQMHFRPTNYSGILDAETAAIACALHYKYIQQKNNDFSANLPQHSTII